MVNNVPFGTMIITGNYPVNGVTPNVKVAQQAPVSSPMMKGMNSGRDTIEFSVPQMIEDDPTGIKNMPNPFGI